MDFELSEDQVALQTGVRSFLEGRLPIPTVRGLEASGGVDRGLWRELGDLGVFSLRLPEAQGGVAMGWAEAVLVYEELGRAIVPGPLVWTHLAADLIAGAANGDVVVGGIERSDASGLIEYAASLDVLLVVDDDGVSSVDPHSLELAPIGNPLDSLTPVSRLRTALPAGERVLDAGGAEEFRLRGAVLVAALLLGISEAATDLAVEFAKQRQQFDQPIGAFQALKHMMADMLVRTEVARGGVYAAGVTLDDPLVGSAPRAVSAAKFTAGEAAVENAKSSVQIHGGMGYTWEIDAHLHFKRAYVLDPMFGGRDFHADQMSGVFEIGSTMT